jgi:hypothetical protein
VWSWTVDVALHIEAPGNHGPGLDAAMRNAIGAPKATCTANASIAINAGTGR